MNILEGTGRPPISLGDKGDMYIDTNDNIYIKTDFSTWRRLGITRTRLASYEAVVSDLTNATASTLWVQDGQFLVLDGQIKWTGAGAGGALRVDLPGAAAGNPLIDTDAIPGGTGTDNNTNSLLGYGFWFDSGNGWLFTNPVYDADTNTIGFVRNTQVVIGTDFANGDAFNFHVRVPIVGWE